MNISKELLADSLASHLEKSAILQQKERERLHIMQATSLQNLSLQLRFSFAQVDIVVCWLIRRVLVVQSSALTS